MKALTVRQPWAWAIVHAGKTIENRTWATKYRGPLLIHAAKGRPTRAEMTWAAEYIERITGPVGWHSTLTFGDVIGVVDLVDVITTPPDSPWWMGPVGWVLRNPRPCQPWPLHGQLGLFDATPPFAL